MDNPINLLCDPKTRKPLTQKNSMLVAEDGKTYPIQHGIPVLIRQQDIVGLNRKYQRFYDIIARGYDFAFWLYAFFNRDIIGMRKSLLKDLVIKPGMRVLETSIGTGFNISLFTKEAEYHGIDISMGMLKVCQRENKKWGYDLQIVQANAEELPYRDNIFDVVFHVGGINFFNDISKAINEMIRVAKPGAEILICDEMQEHVEKSYKRIPFVCRFFKDAKPVFPPLDLIPKNMHNIKLSYSNDKSMYIITFTKPNQGSI